MKKVLIDIIKMLEKDLSIEVEIQKKLITNYVTFGSGSPSLKYIFELRSKIDAYKAVLHEMETLTN